MALRLMDFVSEDQVEKEKELYDGGPRRQDRERRTENERPLYEILKENKDKKDQEFTEKFKHQPPKALDDDETEFLEAVEMHKREVESKQKEEEAEQLLTFQAALASRTVTADEPRLHVKPQNEGQEVPSNNKRRPTLPISVKFKVVPKRSKLGSEPDDEQLTKKVEQTSEGVVSDESEDKKSDTLPQAGLLGLGAYSDDSDDSDDSEE